mmetsp:Transcript_1667/g.4090  ORF Transcript_1667/g.4090 Transcript_1667/m.4090 type:complete len:623 (+) Transcript_1667:517-2385(+)
MAAANMNNWDSEVGLQTIPEDQSVSLRQMAGADDAAMSAISGNASSIQAGIGVDDASPQQAQQSNRWWRGGRGNSKDNNNGNDSRTNYANEYLSPDGATRPGQAAPSAPSLSGRSGVSATAADIGGGRTGSLAPSEQSPASLQDETFSDTKKGVLDCNNQTRWYAILVVVISAVAIVAVILGVVLGTKDDGSSPRGSVLPSENGDKSQSPSVAEPPLTLIPTQAPAPEPTLPPFDLSQESEMPTSAPTRDAEFVSSLNSVVTRLSSSERFANPESPQSQCRNWMLTVDQIKAADTSEQQLEQRYIMCVFFVTAGGNLTDPSATSWTYQLPNKAAHECDWQGLGCDDDKRIATITIRDDNLKGEIAEEIMELTHLQIILLKNNNLSGQLPPKLLDKLPSLIWFDVSENNLSGPIPSLSPASQLASNQTMYNLSNLLVYNNSFTGVLPYFSQLEQAWVRGNQLSGFDEQYTQSQVLFKFIAYSNNMTGPLHQDWTNPKLRVLDLGDNAFTGVMPASLWDIPTLAVLSLYNNQLEGELPTNFTGRAYEKCWLQSNNLTGTIPDGWAKGWTNLTELLLFDNQLDGGSIDQEQCDAWRSLGRLEVDCAIDCECCTAECRDNLFGTNR